MAAFGGDREERPSNDPRACGGLLSAVAALTPRVEFGLVTLSNAGAEGMRARASLPTLPALPRLPRVVALAGGARRAAGSLLRDGLESGADNESSGGCGDVNTLAATEDMTLGGVPGSSGSLSTLLGLPVSPRLHVAPTLLTLSMRYDGAGMLMGSAPLDGARGGGTCVAGSASLSVVAWGSRDMSRSRRDPGMLTRRAVSSSDPAVCEGGFAAITATCAFFFLPTFLRATSGLPLFRTADGLPGAARAVGGLYVPVLTGTAESTPALVDTEAWGVRGGTMAKGEMGRLVVGDRGVVSEPTRGRVSADVSWITTPPWDGSREGVSTGRLNWSSSSPDNSVHSSSMYSRLQINADRS